MEEATFEFKDHKLVGDHWKGRSPNSSGSLHKPTVIVLHYTASGGKDGSGDTAFLSRRGSGASAHFVVGREGDVSQIVETNRKAWHAGKSFWNGKSNVNGFSIGIEIDNWGWLTKRADGTFVSYTGAIVPPHMVVEAQHKDDRCRHMYWEAYTPEQIDSVIALCKALYQYIPSLTEIVGHEDVSPGRKTDPGPALPWQHILAEVEGNSNDMAGKKEVTASALNVRGGPGTNFGVVGKLKRGTKVTEFYRDGKWAHIHYNSVWGMKEGWVHVDYIR